MSQPKLLLDTDILSAVMRQQPKAVEGARRYLNVHPQFTFSIITRYKILRGLKSKQALSQLAAFDRFCSGAEILPVTEDVIAVASDIYAHLYRSGVLIGDADILIAATAQVSGLVIATNNERHFRRVPGAMIDNWLA